MSVNVSQLVLWCMVVVLEPIHVTDLYVKKIDFPNKVLQPVNK